MNKQVKQVLSWLLCFTLLFQFLGITTNSNVAYASSFIKIEEFRLYETILAEEHITEEQLAPMYITENLIYEDGIYDLDWDWNSTNGYVGGLPVTGILVTVVFYWSDTMLY